LTIIIVLKYDDDDDDTIKRHKLFSVAGSKNLPQNFISIFVTLSAFCNNNSDISGAK